MATLATKLQLKAGQRLALHAAPADYAARLADELPDVTLADDDASGVDAVLVFLTERATIAQRLPVALAALRSDGLLWLAYPKGSAKLPTDLNRDKLWQAIEAWGWRPVRQIALDETWSAMRFRRAEDVGR